MTKHGEPGSKNYTKANRSAVLITSKESLQHTIIRTKKRLAKSCPAVACARRIMRGSVNWRVRYRTGDASFRPWLVHVLQGE